MLTNRGPFRRKSLKSYVAQMSKPNPKGIFDDHVASILRQQGFKWTEDPRSIYDPSQLWSALERYATDWKEYEFIDSHLEVGFRKAFKIFAKPKEADHLRLLDDHLIPSHALKLNKSAGLPLMVKKAEALAYGFDRESQVRSGSKAPNPCVAYKRTQKGNKTRLVWGYPLEMTIMEARFARPLIDHFKSVRTPMAFGLSKAELGSYIHKYVVDQRGTIVALDYSKFDSTISAVLIRQAFRILSTWFAKEDLDEYGWDCLVKYFIYTPIVMPDGNLYTGKNHGVPSGSYFTQLIDSIVNVAVCYAIGDKFGLDIKHRAFFVLGDDVLLNIRGEVDLHAWSDYVSSFGLTINVEKTIINVPHFLGAVWYKGKPDTDVQELVHKAIFPESFRDYGGKQRRGAEEVLRSYAANYLSGYRFIPPDWLLRRHDFPKENLCEIKYLTGSDRFLAEERELSDNRSRRSYLATLWLRLLM